jgi:hypothetical protein
MQVVTPLFLACACVIGSSIAHAQRQPSGRACHSAAATDAGMVVWGGAVACGVDVLGDKRLWLWDGTTWRDLPGPAWTPREDALLVNTGDALSLTLVGGRRDGTAHEDVWRFDGRAWHGVPATGGPGPVQHAAAAYDPARRRVVVFGGAAGRTLGQRTFEWDGARWHEFDAPGPAPRVGHGMAWSQADGGVLLYGGFAKEQFRDLWKWAVYDRKRRVLVYWGGSTPGTAPSAAIHEFDGSRWTR